MELLLLLALQEHLHTCEITERTMNRLDSLENIGFHSYSMIYYIKALSLLDRESPAYERFLLRSIEYYDKDVNNYQDLAEHYYDKGDYARALRNFKNAMENVKNIQVLNDTLIREDITNKTELFDYYYRGTTKTHSSKERLDQKIIELEKKVSQLLN